MRYKIKPQNEYFHTESSLENSNLTINQILKWKHDDLETSTIAISNQYFPVCVPKHSSVLLKLKKLTPLKALKLKTSKITEKMSSNEQITLNEPININEQITFNERINVNDSKSPVKLPPLKSPQKTLSIHKKLIAPNHYQTSYYNISLMIDKKISNLSPTTALQQSPKLKHSRRYNVSNLRDRDRNRDGEDSLTSIKSKLDNQIFPIIKTEKLLEKNRKKKSHLEGLTNWDKTCDIIVYGEELYSRLTVD